jgi:hypothetical protein
MELQAKNVRLSGESMIPKKPALGLDPRLDIGFPPARSLAESDSSQQRFGGRSQVGKDHAQTTR